MTRRAWARRGVIALAWWLATWAVVAIVYDGVRPALLAGVVFGVCAFCWLLRDGLRVVAPAEWSAEYRSRPPALGMDGRLTRLSSVLTIAADRVSVTEEIHHALVVIVDDRLRASYGVDRTQDPQAARRVLGSDLDDYVSHRPRPFRIGYHRYLSRILTRIESL